MKALQITLLSTIMLVACGAIEHWPQVPLVHSLEGSRGSGVVIADGWLLTVAHVLPVTGLDDDHAMVQRVHLHPHLDLALVKIEGLKGKVEIATELPKFGDELRTIGHHEGQVKLMTSGHQGKVPGHMSCEVMPGCSGGPVLNARGELVGIVATVWIYRLPFGGSLPISHMAGYTPIDADTRAWILSIVNL